MDDNLDNKVPKKSSVKRNKKMGKIDFKGKTVPEILGLAGELNESLKSQFSMLALDVDRELFDDIRNASPVIDKLVNSGDSILKTYPELSNDLYQSLYQPYPEMYDSLDVKGTYQFNHQIIDSLTTNEDHEILRNYCVLDEFGAALASLNFHEATIENLTELYKEIKDVPGNIIDQINESKASQNEIDSLIDKIKNITEIKQNSGPSPDLDAEQNSTLLSLEQAMKLAQKQSEQLSKVNKAQAEELRKVKDAIAESAKQAVVQIAKDTEMVEAWGFNRGTDVRVSLDNKLQAIRMLRNSKKLKKFSDIIGKLRECAIKEQMSKNKDGISAIKSIIVGSKIDKILPSELMLLNNKTTKSDFYKRYLENSLFQYEMDSMEKKGKGPLIVCVDISPSMDTGDREIYAKAFAVALLDISQIQKRNYAYISFESVVVSVFVQEKGYLDPSRVVQICEEGTRGGTAFQPPLQEALKLIKDSRFKGADLVFITDGEASLSEDFIKKFKKIKEEKEFVCRGILINTGTRCSSKALETFCDKIDLISNIADLGSNGAISTELFRDL